MPTDDRRLLSQATMEHRQRVSCAALCEIRNARGDYLLALNQDRYLRGRYEYTPIGGALTYTSETFLDDFAAIPEKPETRDLRLFIEPARLHQFKMWFMQRTGRETSPFRELQEELVDELGLLDDLKPHDVLIRFRNFLFRERVTARTGVVGVNTHYFHEIYRVEFVSVPKWMKLTQCAADSRGRWVTRADIERGQTPDGIAVDAEILLADR
ncbi:MAG: hypothetical protein GYB67_06705 [Chloroflexi bacterium]|nr:hypothetical protein [Chloroflexota bacterium]